MDLFLMRHAHADDGPRMEATRDLTGKGKHQCRIMRKFLHRIDSDPEFICCSPFLRGLHTAERMAKNNHAPIKVLEELKPDGTPEKALWAVLKAVVPKEKQTGMWWDIDTKVLVIGHHPLIQTLASAIDFGFHDHPEMFNHGNMLHIDTEEEKDGMHHFHWFMTTKLAEKLMDRMDDLQESEVRAATLNL